MHKQNITVYDIAKEAGVSVSTVSRVLTGNAPVREEKRKRVQKIIDKYAFQPNALARSLFTKESKMIGFILPDITHQFFASVFLEAEKYALNLGYTMFLCNSMGDTALESKYLKILTEKQVDGIILMGGRTNQSKTRKKDVDEIKALVKRIPVAIISGKLDGVECYQVMADEGQGILKLMDYLIGMGHREIGFLGGKLGNTSTDMKLSAYKDSLKNNGLDYKDEWVVLGGYGIETGMQCMEEAIGRGKLPSAMVALNDFIAVGAIKAAQAKGIRVPEDLSIVGFDDMYLAKINTPGITTINQNYTELGKNAVEMILKSGSREELERQIIVDTELIVRESCKAVVSSK